MKKNIFSRVLIIILVIIGISILFLYNLNDDNISSLTKYKDKENQYLASVLHSEYNISLNYGSDVKLYMGIYGANTEYNNITINNEINLLVKTLKLYPKEFFEELKLHNYSFKIYIVNSFSDKITLAKAKKENKILEIIISNNKDFVRTFHHEMFHIIEYYLADKYKTRDIFKDWNSYNPCNFQYDKNYAELTNMYIYSNSNIDNSYFVSLYSKASEKEDRAEIFTELMINSNYWQKSETIRQKTNYILDILYKYEVFLEI